MKQLSYFDKEIKRDKEDFLMRKDPIRIQRDAIKIFRDIAFGNIKQEHYIYFANEKLLANLLIAAKMQYNRHLTYKMALSHFAMSTPQDIPNMNEYMNISGKLTDAYATIISGLETIYVGQYNLGYIPILSSRLAPYKYDLMNYN